MIGPFKIPISVEHCYLDLVTIDLIKTAIGSNLRYHILFAEFVVNLSYRLGIGEQFETWQAEEPNWRKGLEAKVFLFERNCENI